MHLLIQPYLPVFTIVFTQIVAARVTVLLSGYKWYQVIQLQPMLVQTIEFVHHKLPMHLMAL